MEILMLAGALVAALGGMSALAFRVVRLPLGKRGKAGKAGARLAITSAAGHAGWPTRANAGLAHSRDE